MEMELREQIKQHMSLERFKHTLGVAETAVKLANVHGMDEAQAETAAMFHDIARDYTDQDLKKIAGQYMIAMNTIEFAVPQLLHGKVGAAIAEDRFNVKDIKILEAIYFHTTGRRKMSQLEKIIFIADMIEPGRQYPGVNRLREVVWSNLDQAVLEGLNSTIRFVLEEGRLIHPASIEARNWLIRELQKRN